MICCQLHKKQCGVGMNVSENTSHSASLICYLLPQVDRLWSPVFEQLNSNSLLKAGGMFAVCFS